MCVGRDDTETAEKVGRMVIKDCKLKGQHWDAGEVFMLGIVAWERIGRLYFLRVSIRKRDTSAG